ncbi:hypothetical protein V8F33_006503 [Rhypophila sp. PSN 637]
MSSRKGHNKSRHGCIRCKERRVKCNEIGPCNHCLRRREDCSLAPANHSIRQSSSNGSSPGAYSPSPETSTSFLSPFIRYGPSDSSWSQDLYLMSHFLLSSCKTITARSDIIHMWQQVVPKDAVAHPFLMHGILAFSALHLASLHPDDPPLRLQYARLSQHHQSEAIPEFRKCLANLRPESAGPCFAMGSILACLAVAAVSDNRLDRALDEGSPGFSFTPVTYETILAIFTLIRGVRSILDPAWAWETFSGSPYANATHGHGKADNDSFALPPQTQDHYISLQQKIHRAPSCEFSESQKTACIEALSEREKVEKDLVYHREKGRPVEQSFLFKWVAVVPDDFVSLLMSRNTVAVGILRGFVLLVRLLRDRGQGMSHHQDRDGDEHMLDDAHTIGESEDAWYLKGFVENAIGAIDGLLI